MSQKRLQHAHILDRLVRDNSFTISQAAEAMGLSERHTKRLKGEWIKNGIDALVHKNIGRSPVHALSEELRNTIIDLKTSKLFEKANFNHFREILGREKYGIQISYSALHGILTSAGIKSPKTRRPSKKHRRRKHNGIPVSLYADRHTIFLSPKDGKLTIEEQLQGIQVKDTQFGRAVKQLGITLIKARSAQAKGRIERLWETLQSRLPIEFALENISTIDAANAFLKKYIDEYNSMFAVEAENTETVYREVSPALNIENILCIIEKRKFDNGGIFSFYNRHFKLVSSKPDIILPHRGKLDVLVSPIFGVRASFAGIVYDVVPYIKPEKSTKPASSKSAKQKYIPDDSHYYKYGHQLIKKVTFEDNDIAILKMLENIFLWRLPPAS